MTFVQSFIVAVIGVEIAVLAQVLLKRSAMFNYDSVIRQYLNWRVILAYAMMVLSTLFSLFAYRVLPLSYAPIMNAISTLSITIFSRFIFNEEFTKRKVVGFALIILGILVFLIPGVRIL